MPIDVELLQKIERFAKWLDWLGLMINGKILVPTR